MASAKSIMYFFDMSNKILLNAVKSALSPARMNTYELASGMDVDGGKNPLILYAWNALVSGALLTPLHICEVVVRNAVADALQATYGPAWPWSSVLELSLPKAAAGYCQRQDLTHARVRFKTVGQVIPELKFAFWQRMFTQRHDARVWDRHLREVLPCQDPTMPTAILRQRIFEDLEQIRRLRNRIAHHEPVFKRDLDEDFRRITGLIRLRCQMTADWMLANQHATALLAANPTGSAPGAPPAASR